MTLTFQPIGPDRQADYQARLQQCPQKSSDYSYINLWGWSDVHGLQWAWQEDVVWIRQTLPQTVLWAPVGPWDRVDWAARMAEPWVDGATFVRVPERLSDLWKAVFGSRVIAMEARADWDYLYAVEDLVHLKGNRFHKKKNLVNQFTKSYGFTYAPLGPETLRMASAMQGDWCTWRDCESVETLSAENRAIEKVLSSWEWLDGILGGSLMVDGRMVAYTIAEQLSADTLLIHFEKADPEFKGAYQAINRIFLEHADVGTTWVNREQDLGDAGLRKAKLSYHPVDFVRKYRVTY